MNTETLVVLLICSVLIASVSITSLLTVRTMYRKSMEMLTNLAQRSEQERERLLNRQDEREKDFLNRLMTKEWQSYAQLGTNQSGSISDFVSPTESDHGTGEVLIDLDND